MGKPAMKADKMMHMKDCMEDEMEEDMDMMVMKKMPMVHGHPMMLLAHAYVPWQCYDRAFSPREALMHGTLFPELWGVYPIPE
jgi:uncharacterized membrane protein (DUF106 family)